VAVAGEMKLWENLQTHGESPTPQPELSPAAQFLKLRIRRLEAIKHYVMMSCSPSHDAIRRRILCKM